MEYFQQKKMQRLRTVSVVLWFKLYEGDFYIGQELFDFSVKLGNYFATY